MESLRCVSYLLPFLQGRSPNFLEGHPSESDQAPHGTVSIVHLREQDWCSEVVLIGTPVPKIAKHSVSELQPSKKQ